MSKHFILLLSIFFLLCSCQPEGRIYVKHKKLSPDIEWMKADVKLFEIPIENTDKSYRMSLAFRYANGYQFDKLIVNIKESSPSGILKEYEKEIKIRDEAGKYIGEPGYDIWDCEQVIEAKKKFNEKGKYSYELSHKMPNDQLHYGMEIGMILDEN